MFAHIDNVTNDSEYWSSDWPTISHVHGWYLVTYHGFQVAMETRHPVQPEVHTYDDE